MDRRAHQLRSQDHYDLAEAMSQNLRADEAESVVKAGPASTAMECLCKAADILENIGDHKTAELTTMLLEKLASGK